MRDRVARIAGRRLHDARHMLDRHDAGTCRDQGVGPAEMRGDGEAQLVGFIEQRSQQRRRDLRVDLEIVHAGDGMLVHRASRLIGGRDAGRVGVRRRHAIDHRAGGEHPRARDRPKVHRVSQRQHRVGAAVQIAHGRDAPGYVPACGPPFHVRVRVDQSRDDGFADHIDPLRALRNRDLVDTGDRRDVTVADDDQRVGLRCAAGAVDQRRAFERDDALLGGEELATRDERQDETQQHPADCLP